MDQIERYLEVFEQLRARKKWSTGVDVLRFAALTLAAADVDAVEVNLEAAARKLADEGGAFSPLGSSIRHAVAAILIRRDLDPVTVVRNTKKTLASFKEHRLQRSGLRPLLAALVLVLDADGSAPHPARIARVQAIIARWKEDHRWLTGTDDYPMAALHATRDADVELIGLEVEEIYQQLKRERFRTGEQLQLASHLLAFSGLGPREAALRFQRVASELRRCGQRIGTRHYDELALLAVSGLRARDAVARVIEYRDRLRAVRPRPAADIALSIAAGVVLAAAADEAGAIEDAAEAAGLRAVQAMVEAQQAAMVASIAAVSAATTVAAS